MEKERSNNLDGLLEVPVQWNPKKDLDMEDLTSISGTSAIAAGISGFGLLILVALMGILYRRAMASLKHQAHDLETNLDLQENPKEDPKESPQK